MSRHGLDRDSRSRRRQRVSLDSRENLDSVKKLVSTIEISRSRSRNLSRSEIFGISRKFVSTEKCVDFCIFSSRFLNPLRLKASTMSRFLDKSRLRLDKSRKSRHVSTNLDNLDASRQSRQKSRRIKVSTEKSRF